MDRAPAFPIPAATGTSERTLPAVRLSARQRDARGIRRPFPSSPPVRLVWLCGLYAGFDDRLRRLQRRETPRRLSKTEPRQYAQEMLGSEAVKCWTSGERDVTGN